MAGSQTVAMRIGWAIAIAAKRMINASPTMPIRFSRKRPQVVTRTRPLRIASGPVAGKTVGEGSTLPIVAGILLLAGGLAAIVHAARDGRT